MYEVVHATEIRPSVLLKRAKRRVIELSERSDLSTIRRGRDKMKDEDKLRSLSIALRKPRGVFTVDQELYILSQVAGLSARFQEKDRLAQLRKKNRSVR